MDVLSDAEVYELTNRSAMVKKYDNSVNKESAYEMLTQRMNATAEELPQSKAKNTKTTVTKEDPGMIEQVFKSRAGRTFTNTLMREGAKAILGMLGLTKKR